MAGHSAFATGFARFLARPLVGGALRMRRLAAFARDLALLGPVHRGESAILFCHANLLIHSLPSAARATGPRPCAGAGPTPSRPLSARACRSAGFGCNAGATAQEG